MKELMLTVNSYLIDFHKILEYHEEKLHFLPPIELLQV